MVLKILPTCATLWSYWVTASLALAFCTLQCEYNLNLHVSKWNWSFGADKKFNYFDSFNLKYLNLSFCSNFINAFSWRDRESWVTFEVVSKCRWKLVTNSMFYIKPKHRCCFFWIRCERLLRDSSGKMYIYFFGVPFGHSGLSLHGIERPGNSLKIVFRNQKVVKETMRASTCWPF